jgi:hypothetical protein
MSAQQDMPLQAGDEEGMTCVNVELWNYLWWPFDQFFTTPPPQPQICHVWQI